MLYVGLYCGSLRGEWRWTGLNKNFYQSEEKFFMIVPGLVVDGLRK